MPSLLLNINCSLHTCGSDPHATFYRGVSPGHPCLKFPIMDAGGGVSLQSKEASPCKSRKVQVWGEATDGADPTPGPLQHHIKTGSPSEDDGAANHSVHLCKLQLLQLVLPTLSPSPQVFLRLPSKGPLPRVRGAKRTFDGCMG